MRHGLLIEGDRQGCHELSTLFGKFGFDLTQSDSASDALLQCQQLAPDVVVLMEPLDELAAPELVKRLRRTGQGKPPVVLVYSERPSTAQIGRLIIDGVAECLMKPLDQDILGFKLRQVGLI